MTVMVNAVRLPLAAFFTFIFLSTIALASAGAFEGFWQFPAYLAGVLALSWVMSLTRSYGNSPKKRWSGSMSSLKFKIVIAAYIAACVVATASLWISYGAIPVVVSGAVVTQWVNYMSMYLIPIVVVWALLVGMAASSQQESPTLYHVAQFVGHFNAIAIIVLCLVLIVSTIAGAITFVKLKEMALASPVLFGAFVLAVAELIWFLPAMRREFKEDYTDKQAGAVRPTGTSISGGGQIQQQKIDRVITEHIRHIHEHLVVLPNGNLAPMGQGPVMEITDYVWVDDPPAPVALAPIAPPAPVAPAAPPAPAVAPAAPTPPAPVAPAPAPTAPAAPAAPGNP